MSAGVVEADGSVTGRTEGAGSGAKGLPRRVVAKVVEASVEPVERFGEATGTAPPLTCPMDIHGLEQQAVTVTESGRSVAKRPIGRVGRAVYRQTTT